MIVRGHDFRQKLAVVQVEELKVKGVVGGEGGNLNETHAAVRADLPSQSFVDKLHRFLAEDPGKFVDAEVDDPKLGHEVAHQVQHHNVTTVTQHALDVEVLNGGEVGWDVIVLKVLRHLCELALPAEGEDRPRLVHIDDALPADAERGVALLVHHAAARHRRLQEPSSS